MRTRFDVPAALSSRGGHRRLLLRLATGLSGSVLALGLITPQAAHAQSDCGGPVDGLIDCAPRDDQYKDGIAYIGNAPDLSSITAVIEPGTIVATQNHAAIFLSNLNGPMAILATGATITTSGDNATGIFGHANQGSVSIRADSVVTTGDHSTGIVGVAGAVPNPELPLDARGSVTISAGNVTTYGLGSYGIDTLATGGGNGSINIAAGTVTTHGNYAVGIHAEADSGSIELDAGTVGTSGDGAVGVSTLVGALNGRANLTIGSVETSGNDAIGIYSIGYGSSTVSAGSVSTRGDRSVGIAAASIVGSVEISSGTVATQGAESSAIIAKNTYGNVSVNAGTLSTAGDRSFGVYAQDVNGSVHVTAGTIATAGAYSTGLFADSRYDRVEVHAGSIDTSGYAAGGLLVHAGKDVSVSVDHVRTTGDDAAGVAVSSGLGGLGLPTLSGDMNVTVGSVETSGQSSTGVGAINFGHGALNLTVGTVVTSGDGSVGVTAGAAHGAQTTSIGQVWTRGANATGVDIAEQYGALGLTIGTIETDGAGSNGLFFQGTEANAVIDLTQGIVTHGAGSNGASLGARSGSIAFTNHGTIVTTGDNANGIEIAADRAQITLNAGQISTSGAGSIGIHVAAADEPYFGAPTRVDVTAGTIVTTGAGAHGIDIADGDPPAGGGIGTSAVIDLATVPTPGQDVNVTAGTVYVSGADAIGVRVVANGTATLAVGSVRSAQASAISVDARGATTLGVTGQIAGGGPQAVVLAGSDVAVSLTAGGSITGANDALVIDAKGPYVAPPSDGGGGVFFRAAEAASPGVASIDNAGTIAGGTGFAIRVNQGTAAISNSGRIVGAVSLADGNDTLVNSGIFAATGDSDFGAGTDLFTNSGTVSVLAGSKTAGTVHFLGLERFNNSGGLIDLRNGHTGDSLILSGAYAGSAGARLGLDIALGKTGATSDSLVIGGAATGSTAILLTNLDASTATLTAKPITLVSVGAGSSATAFTLDGGSRDIGLIRYSLVYDGATGLFGLTGAAGAPVARLARTNEAAQTLWLKSADAWSAHMATLRSGDEAGDRIWGQFLGGVNTRKGTATLSDGSQAADHYRQDYEGAQIGIDLARSRSDRGALVFGATGGYLGSKVNGGGDRQAFDAANLGAYAAWSSDGFFVSALAKYDRYWVKLSNASLGYKDQVTGAAWGAQADVGYRFGSDRLFVQPAASLAWTRTSLGDAQLLGQTIDFASATGLRGKAGAQLGGRLTLAGGSSAILYGGGSVVREFSGKGGLTLLSGGTSQRVGQDRLGTYGEVKLGLNVVTTGRLSGFVEGTADVGKTFNGGGGKVGLRFGL